MQVSEFRRRLERIRDGISGIRRKLDQRRSALLASVAEEREAVKREVMDATEGVVAANGGTSTDLPVFRGVVASLRAATTNNTRRLARRLDDVSARLKDAVLDEDVAKAETTSAEAMLALHRVAYHRLRDDLLGDFHRAGVLSLFEPGGRFRNVAHPSAEDDDRWRLMFVVNTLKHAVSTGARPSLFERFMDRRAAMHHTVGKMVGEAVMARIPLLMELHERDAVLAKELARCIAATTRASARMNEFGSLVATAGDALRSAQLTEADDGALSREAIVRCSPNSLAELLRMRPMLGTAFQDVWLARFARVEKAEQLADRLRERSAALQMNISSLDTAISKSRRGSGSVKSRAVSQLSDMESRMNAALSQQDSMLALLIWDNILVANMPPQAGLTLGSGDITQFDGIDPGAGLDIPGTMAGCDPFGAAGSTLVPLDGSMDFGHVDTPSFDTSSFAESGSSSYDTGSSGFDSGSSGF